jgi:anti-anti-sigma regulatory factor
MASNFNISKHQNRDSLHLKLSGDFDGTSAWELFNILKDDCRNASKIFIHCNCLNEIDPFGQAVFHGNFHSLKKDSARFLFTGEKARQIAPEGIGFL